MEIDTSLLINMAGWWTPEEEPFDPNDYCYWTFGRELLQGQEDLNPKIQKMISKEFWKLLA